MPLHGFLRSSPQHAVLAFSASQVQIENVVNIQGGELRPRELQERYQAALSRMAGAKISGIAEKHVPIVQRAPAPTEKQSIQEAANALSALWKIRMQPEIHQTSKTPTATIRGKGLSGWKEKSEERSFRLAY